MLDAKKRAFDVAEVSQLTGLTIDQVRNLIKAGRIKGFQPAGRLGKWFVARDELGVIP